MTRLRRLAFLAMLSTWMVVPGCAHVQPVISTVVTCSGQTIPAGLVNEVYADIMAENWNDLATVAVPALADGWADVACIYDALKGANPALVGHMQNLKAGHVELRAVAENLLRGGPSDRSGGPYPSQPGSTPGPATEPFAYSGTRVATELSACEAACGGPDALAPPSGCLCHVGRGRDARWVAAR